MTIKQLINILQKVKNKDRYLQVLVGNEDKDYFASDHFNLMHIDDVEQCVEIFIHNKDIYKI